MNQAFPLLPLRDIVVFPARVVALGTGHRITSVLVALSKVPLGHRDLALRAVAEFDTSVAAGKVGANQFFAVLDIFRNDKISSL